ncbi:hypothetical protein A6R68_05426, partial [Neotoma lepida]
LSETIDVDEELKLCSFCVKLMAVEASLCEEWKRYVTKGELEKRVTSLFMDALWMPIQKHYTKKNEEEAVEYVKVLVKRMKEVKEKCQEQIINR